MCVCVCFFLTAMNPIIMLVLFCVFKCGCFFFQGVKVEQASDVMYQLLFIGDCLSDYMYIVEKDKERQRAARLAAQSNGAT